MLLNTIGVPIDFAKIYTNAMLNTKGLRITRLVLSELAGPRAGGAQEQVLKRLHSNAHRLHSYQP